MGISSFNKGTLIKTQKQKTDVTFLNYLITWRYRDEGMAGITENNNVQFQEIRNENNRGNKQKKSRMKISTRTLDFASEGICSHETQ